MNGGLVRESRNKNTGGTSDDSNGYTLGQFYGI